MHSACLNLGYRGGRETICFSDMMMSHILKDLIIVSLVPRLSLSEAFKMSTIKYPPYRKQPFMTLQWQDQWFYAPRPLWQYVCQFLPYRLCCALCWFREEFLVSFPKILCLWRSDCISWWSFLVLKHTSRIPALSHAFRYESDSK